MRGDERFVPADPPGGAADAVIRERRVEADDDGVGVVVTFNKTMLDEFLAERRRAEDERVLQLGSLAAEVLGRAMRRREDVGFARLDAGRVQLRDVLLRASRGVVGKKSPADAKLRDLREERPRELEQPAAEVERAVEVEGEVAEFG